LHRCLNLKSVCRSTLPLLDDLMFAKCSHCSQLWRTLGHDLVFWIHLLHLDICVCLIDNSGGRWVCSFNYIIAFLSGSLELSGLGLDWGLPVVIAISVVRGVQVHLLGRPFRGTDILHDHFDRLLLWQGLIFGYWLFNHVVLVLLGVHFCLGKCCNLVGWLNY